MTRIIIFQKSRRLRIEDFLSMMNGHVLEHGQHHTLVDLMQKCMIIFRVSFTYEGELSLASNVEFLFYVRWTGNGIYETGR